MKKTIIKVSVSTITVLTVVTILVLIIKDSKSPFISQPSTPKYPNTCNCLQHIKKIEERYHKFTTIESGYVRNPGKYIAKNQEELQKLAKLNNIDFSMIATDDFDYMNDNYIYFVEFVNTTASYDIKATKFILDNDRAYFNTFDESKLSSSGNSYASVMGGFCFIAMVPADEINSDDISSINYTDRDGNVWKKTEL